MHHPFLIGERIYLRALEENDLTGNYLQWFNDSEVCTFNSHALFPNNTKKMQEYFKFVDPNSAVVLAIILKEKDIHIGNVSIQEIIIGFQEMLNLQLFWAQKIWNKCLHLKPQN